MTSIDNKMGLGAHLGSAGPYEYEDLVIEVKDNMIYGETEAKDCPSLDDDFCFLIHKNGFHPPLAAHDAKKPMTTTESAMPLYKPKSETAWGAKGILHNNTFTGFTAKTKLGEYQSIFALNKYNHNYVPMIKASDNTFVDVEDGAIAHLIPINPDTANKKDCGEFPCTGPNNVLFSLTGTKFTGTTKPSFDYDTFQIIANNTDFAPHMKNCVPKEVWNAYLCQEKSLAILQFESKDADWKDRGVQPVYIKLQGTEVSNKLNSYMDDVWDGFYAGQIRMTRFPSILEANPESVNDITYTGTPPKKQIFQLYSLDPASSTILRIAYPSAGAFQVSANGVKVPMNDWNDIIQNYSPITRSKCGENRYLAVVNILEFYLTPGCEILVEPRDAIQTKVRLEWTVDDFYAKGGTTTFVDRLAGSLGIHASTIKVVGVYTGSLVVDYNIFAPEDASPASVAEVLQQIQQTQVMQIATGTLDLGAPVLDFEQDDAPIVSDGTVSAAGYDPVILTPTLTNSGTNFEALRASSSGVVQTGTKKTFTANEVEQGYFSPDISIVEEEVAEVRTAQSATNEVISAPANNMPYVIVGLVVLVVILSVIGIKTIVRFNQQQVIDHARIKQAKETYELADQASISVHPNVKEFSIDEHGEKIEPSTGSKLVNEFEAQYDANHDFAIFGAGDPAQGGVQSLQQKMNMADALEHGEEQPPQQSTTKSGSNHSAENMSSGENILPEDKEIEEL